MKHLYCLLFLVLPFAASAQPAQRATLTGDITNAADGKPLPFASVYLNGSTKGTTSDENGRFTLGEVPFGSIELVVSYTGFSAVRQSIRITEVKPRPVAIALSPLANQLADVVVKAQKDKVWLKQLRHFEREILGKGNFAGSCVLVNPEVLNFTEAGRILLAEASAPLIIDNQSLGYRLTYTLNGFRSQPERVTFGGTTLFKELSPDTPKQAKQWQRNREDAYRGSLRHLLASIAAGNHEQESFLIYVSDPTVPLLPNLPPLLSNEVGRHLKPFKAAEMVLVGTLPHERWLRSPQPLVVFYTRIASRETPYGDAPYAYSQLILPRGMLGFTVAGQITAPMGFDATGYLSNDRIGNALPDDWDRDAPPPVVQEKKPVSQSASNGTTNSSPAMLDTLVQRWKKPTSTDVPAVLVHVAKPMYLTGDRLWLSAYVVDAHTKKLDSALTGPALNVELWSSENRLIQHQWLPVTDGRAAGMFWLSDSLATGTYWLRAYTEASRSEKRPAFERPVWVVSAKSSLAVKATDNQGTQSENSPHLVLNGSGLDAPDVPFQTNIEADSSYVTLNLNRSAFGRKLNVFALIDNGQKLIKATQMVLVGAATSWRWSTLTWPAGIARLSVMDSVGRVWATRYVQVPDRSLRGTVQMALGSVAKAGDSQRPLSLTLLDGFGRPQNAHVSVAVTDADQVPVDTLVADFRKQLGGLNRLQPSAPPVANTPDITLYGRVTTNERMPVNVALMVPDKQKVVVLVTKTEATGHFSFNKLALPDTAHAIVRVTSLSGKAIDAGVQFTQPMNAFEPVGNWAGAEQLLASWKNLILLAAARQNAEPLAYRQTRTQQLREVVVRATKPIDNRPDDIRQRSLHDKADQTIVLDHLGASFDNLYSLIRAKVPQTVVQQVLDNGQVKYSVKFNGGTVSSVAVAPPPRTIGSAPVAPLPSTPGSLQNPLFLIDGFPINDTDGLQLLAFSPNDIERIEVMKTAATAAIYGLQGSRGVIAFYTKVPRAGASIKGVSRQTLLGYPVAPTSSLASQKAGNQPDVLAWLPLAFTNPQGQLTVPVAALPSLRVLRITIQGITQTGEPISVVKLLPVR